MSAEYRLGQVGGFPLRLSWLPRMVALSEQNDKIISDAESTALKMGIGMNMVKALRMWAKAAGIINNKSGNEVVTSRGKKLFSSKTGVDKYAEKEETLWLLHWLICSNLDCFTANGWLLNFFQARSFTASSALEAFSSHLEKHHTSRLYSRGTIRVDLETALRMYAAVEDKKNSGDFDDYHFRMMRLFLANRSTGETRYTRILRNEQPRLSDKVIAYAVVDAMTKRKTSVSPFSSLYFGYNHMMPAPGLVFGYTKDGFLTALENIQQKYPKIFFIQPMPEGDFQVQLRGNYENSTKKDDISAADNFYFSKIA